MNGMCRSSWSGSFARTFRNGRLNNLSPGTLMFMISSLFYKLYGELGMRDVKAYNERKL